MQKSGNIFRPLDPKWLKMPLFPAGGLWTQHTTIGLEDHGHTCFELTYLRSGEVTWELSDGTRMDLHGGDAAVMQPHVMHRGELEKIRPCELFWIFVYPSARNALRFTPFCANDVKNINKELVRVGNQVVNAHTECGLMFDAAKSLLDDLKKSPESSMLKARIRLSVIELALSIVRSFSVQAERRISSPIYASMNFLTKNLQNRNAASLAAREAGLSLSRFFERFKIETGLSPHEFVVRKRCEKAQVLLEQGSLSLTRVALEAGFYSSQHFSSLFKTVIGMTPGEYRRKSCLGR